MGDRIGPESAMTEASMDREPFLRAGLVEEADEDTKVFGVTTGTVTELRGDPMGLGRVQVNLPFIDSLDPFPWARVAVPMAGPAHGTYFIPNIGDEVLVAF